MGSKIKFLFKFSLVILILISLCEVGCNTTEPPDPPPPPPPVVEEPVLTLELDDAHCTETWINLKTEKLTLPAELTFKQFNPTGDSVTKNFILSIEDTLLYIDSLLPNQTYNYQVSCIWHPAVDSQQQALSNELNVTTMDTTSHNFTFEMVTFGGEISSSVLYDVAIIDPPAGEAGETQIWAVGEIWIADTSTLGYTKYNVVHWDGSQWELKQLKYNNSFFSPIRGILILNTNDFYFAAGSVFHWDGIDSAVQMVYSRLNLSDPMGTIEKLWGSSNSNLYGVGNVGSLVFYNGTSWQKIESGTTLNINDIWGDFNEKTQEWEILTVGGNVLAGYDNVLLRIQQSNLIEELSTDSADWPLRSLWFKSGRIYYIAGSGIYQKHKLNEQLWKNDIFSITTYSINRIRGKEINNNVATGGAGELLHYNGYSWRSFIDVVGIPGNYYGSDINENIIISVGQSGRQAIITIGGRN